MTAWIGWTAALLLGMLSVFLWFKDVRRIMLERKSTVESAKAQLQVARSRAAASDDPEAAAVLARSEDIYRQALALYNRTLRRPWVRFPAAVMRYRQLPR